MSIQQFLTSRTFLKNLIIAIILVIVIVVSTMQILKLYTRHGQSNPVPDFSGLLIQEAQDMAIKHNLRIQIVDSVYFDNAKPGAVVDQVPYAGFGVKENRTIFLTINSTMKEKVVLPKLTEISFRQAQVIVENCGLIIGEISYQPSEFNNLVLSVSQDSIELLQGDILVKGSSIDLIVGRDPQNEQTKLPDLVGKKPDEAKEILTSAMLNIGVILYDESIQNSEDSTNAIIWQQRPDPKSISLIKLGSAVDIWITVDKEKINQDIELEF